MSRVCQVYQCQCICRLGLFSEYRALNWTWHVQFNLNCRLKTFHRSNLPYFFLFIFCHFYSRFCRFSWRFCIQFIRNRMWKYYFVCSDYHIIVLVLFYLFIFAFFKSHPPVDLYVFKILWIFYQFYLIVTSAPKKSK